MREDGLVEAHAYSLLQAVDVEATEHQRGIVELVVPVVAGPIHKRPPLGKDPLCS